MDSPSHRHSHAIVGPNSRQSLWLLRHPAMGMLRRVRVSCLSRPGPTTSRMGVGPWRYSCGLQSHFPSTFNPGSVVDSRPSRYRLGNSVYLRSEA